MSHINFQIFKQLFLFFLGVGSSIGALAQRATSYDVYGDSVERGLGFGDYLAAIVVAALFALCFFLFKEFRSSVIKFALLVFGIGVTSQIFGKEAGIASCFLCIFFLWKKGSSPTNTPDSSVESASIAPNKVPSDSRPIPSHVPPIATEDSGEKQTLPLVPVEQPKSPIVTNGRKLQCPSCSLSFSSDSVVIKPAVMVPEFVKVTCPSCGDEWIEKPL